MRLDSASMDDVSRLYHTREYEYRTNASMYAQLKSVRDKGLTVMERECILAKVKKERRDMGLAWEHLDGLWEDDRIFHAFDCECCMSDHTDSDGNEEEKQDDESEGMGYTLIGLGKAGELNVGREEIEHIEQEDFVNVEGGEDDDEEEGELGEGEVDGLAADFDAGNEPAEVREDLAQIRVPIAQGNRRRRSGARKRVGRTKKTGKNGKNGARRRRGGYMSATAGR